MSGMQPSWDVESQSPSPRSGRSMRSVGLVLLGALLAIAVAGVGMVFGMGLMNRDASAPDVVAPSAPSPAVLSNDTAATTQAVAGLANDEIGAKFGDSVFLVEATGCEMESSGTAWVLDDKHLLTNWHVVSTDPTPELVSRDGATRFGGTVIGRSVDPDVAVIRVDHELPQALPWAETKDLREGQDVVSLGYPVPASDFSVTPSTIISFQTKDGTREAIRGDGALDHGNSGGPALTRDGEVAGVATLMVKEASQLQMVPLIFTADALRETAEQMIANPEDVEEDCDPGLPTLPDDWAPDFDGWSSAGPQDYGDDAALDSLYDACSAGDMAACDDLWWASSIGSAYESFAMSCGTSGFGPSFGTCELEADWAAEDARQEADEKREQDAAASQISALLAACKQGDMPACDGLQAEAAYGSSEYDAAETCGGHYPDGWGSCVDRKAGAATLQGLVTSCQGGDMQACDDLGWEADYGSAEYDVAETCGGHYPDGYGSCVDRKEDSAALQILVGECRAGDMEACDDLYWESDFGSAEQKVADDCGGYYPGEGGMCVYSEENP